MALRGSGVRIPSAPVFARSVAENEDCRAVASAKADFFQLATIAQRATTWQASQAEPLAAQSEGCHAGVKHRRAALIALFVGRSKTTAWQAKFMTRFFYVYVPGQRDRSPQSITQASRAICPGACKSTTGAVACILQSTDRGKSKRLSDSDLKRRPARSRNI